VVTDGIAAPSRTRQAALVVAAVALTGFTMRLAVTSVGAVLDDLQAGLPASSGASGVLTTLPVLVFAAFGFAAPRLAHRHGEHRLMVAALAVSTLGLAGRALSHGVVAFGLLSLLALVGGAIANVLMPTLVKRHFADRIGSMTAVYTTCLAIGSTAAAGLTVPIAHATGGWRGGLGSWAVVTALAMLPWLPTLRDDRPDPDAASRRLPVALLARTRLGWALALMFGFQSFQAYIAFGWFTDFFRHYSVSATTAGALTAFFAGLSIPISMVIPTVAGRRPKLAVLVLAATATAGYLGMLAAPVAGAWWWMLLAGIGSGMFPLSLTFIGLRSRQVASTAALSAFSQGVGYLVAGTGPLLVGLLLDVTGDDWTWPLLLLIVANLLAAGFGLYAAGDRLVDDQLPVSTPASPA